MSKRENLVNVRKGHVVTYHADYILKDPAKDPTTCLDTELAFTDAFRRHEQDAPAVREAYCLAEEYPSLYGPIEHGDIFPGWLEYDCVGIGLENNSGGVAYYCYNDIIDDLLEKVDFPATKRSRILEMKEYWRTHGTIVLDREVMREMRKRMEEGIDLSGPGRFIMEPECPMGRAIMRLGIKEGEPTLGFQGARLAGVNLDFDRLMQKGVKGLIADIDNAAAKAPEEKKPFYTGMRMAMEVLQGTLRYFAQNAREQRAALSRDQDPVWFQELKTFEEMFTLLAEDKPNSFRSAMQLFWIYQGMSRVVNYSRMDVFLGDFLAHDLDVGVLTEDEAQALVDEMWRLIAAKKVIMNGRVIIGGTGRRNEANADRFALMAMQASKNVIETEPQLTLRSYKGMNPALMDKAMDVIGSGVVYPMLFNDDVNVPAVQNAFRIPYEDAQHYLPYGCGEYGLEHLTIGSPNGGFSVYAPLEAMIFNGKTTSGKNYSIPMKKRFEDYKDFDEFYGDLSEYLHQYSEPQVRRQRLEHDVEAEELAFLYCSALMDDCIARGLPLTGGGARYRGGVVETFGLVNVADSLAVIKKFVFEDKVISPQKLRDMLRANFQGYEAEQKMLIDFPKFGNDNDYTDSIMERLCVDMCDGYNMHAPKWGLNYYLACNVNNRANVEIGRTTPATPEGRFAGKPIANGNTPTAGNDTSGVTAFLTSAARAENDNNGGFTHNMKFSKSMFRDERKKIRNLLDAYFEMGGSSAMITCVGKDDLQKAKKDPENYKSLMVRVGGFSARFVELEDDVQDDIINRTMY